MQRIAYIPIITDPTPACAFKKDVLVLGDTPPDTPFLKVKITVVKYEKRYHHNRAEKKPKGKGRAA